MNFLFLTDEYYPQFGANSLIVRTLARELTSQGNSVFVMPACYDAALPEVEMFEGSSIVRLLPYDGKQALIRAFKKLHLLEGAGIFSMMLGAKLFGPHHLWHKQKISSRRVIQKFVATENIDVVVSINCSVELSFPLLHLQKRGKLPCKWVWYMLDPFESHEYYRTYTSKRKLRKIQHNLMLHCDRVLATDLIYADAKKWEQADVLSKIEIVGFPKIEKPQYIPVTDDISLPDGKINVVCTGSKNEVVRNSAYTLSLCKQIPSVLFHFVGNGWADEVTEEENLRFYPPHSYQCIRNLQQNADFLLNIGNVVDNQLPSKVLEYISTGKPIINIYKTDRCPAKALLEHFEALNIAENDDAVNELNSYLFATHSVVSFAEIERDFFEYTPHQTLTKLFFEK